MSLRNPTPQDARRGDCYFTPRRHLQPLMAYHRMIGLFTPGQEVWECAGGAGHLAAGLAAEGYRVLASDIAPASGPHKHPVVRHDFLASSGLGGGAGAAIVTNPPYGPQSRLALAFIHKGLALIEQGPAIMALLLPFEFDARPSRSALVGEHPFFLAKVTVGERIRWANLPQKDATPMAHHAWFIWSAHVQHHIRAQRFPKVMVR
jgi:hypothetical protein